MGFALALFFLLANPWFSFAQSINQVLDLVQNFYENISTIRGEFVQETLFPNQKKEFQEGRFWIKKPGLFRWEYLHPEKFLIISDGTKLYVYYPEEKRAYVYPTGKVISSQLALGFMSGRGDIRKDLKVESYQVLSGGLWEISFLPLAQENQIEKINLIVDLATGEVKRFSIWHQSGEKLIITFKKVEYNQNTPDKIFRFNPPKDVKIN